MKSIAAHRHSAHIASRANSDFTLNSIPDASKPAVWRKVFFSYISFLLLIVSAAALNPQQIAPRVSYLLILTALVLPPVFAARQNPTHRLLCIFVAAYYLMFAFRDLYAAFAVTRLSFVLGTQPHTSVLQSSLLTYSDIAVLFGLITFYAGYFIASQSPRAKPSRIFARDWNYSFTFNLALLLYLIGFTYALAYNMTVTPFYIPEKILLLPVAVASNLRLLSPLAASMFIYLATRRFRLRTTWTLLAIIILVEFLFGFVANSKEISFRIPALLIVSLYLINGKVPGKILAIIAVVSVPYVAYFNVYRLQVLQVRHQSQTDAFHELDKTIDTVLAAADNDSHGTRNSVESLVQRLDGKIYVDIIVSGVESGKVPTLDGESLYWLAGSFVPRFLWPNKPEASIGQLFNRSFGLSQSRLTYVPTTQLGELFWNFRMTGVLLGMFCIGIIFAFLGNRLYSGNHLSVTRFLMLLMAAYYLAIRFEVNIALQYGIYTRLFFLLFALDRVVRFLGGTRLQNTLARPTRSTDSLTTPALFNRG